MGNGHSLEKRGAGEGGGRIRSHCQPPQSVTGCKALCVRPLWRVTTAQRSEHQEPWAHFSALPGARCNQVTHGLATGALAGEFS